MGSGSFGYASISGDIHVGGDITASNLISNTTISSSGNIFGDTIVVNASTGSQARLTVQGDISSSGDIWLEDGKKINWINSGQNIYGTEYAINIDGDDFVNLTADTRVDITVPKVRVSGNISGSGYLDIETVSASNSVIINASTGSQAQLTVGGEISASKTIYADDFTGGLITDSNSGVFKGWKYRGFYDAGGYIHFGNGFWNLYRSTTKQITGHSTGVTINDTNADVDFQIDGDTNDHVFFVDAALEQIGIGLEVKLN